MTVMPGFIDGHRHVDTGPDEREQMQALLDAGYTTVLSGGGPAEGNITLRDHIESGQIRGPRIIPSGRARSCQEQHGAGAGRDAALGGARHQVHRRDGAHAKAGADAKELENLRALLDEARKVGVHVQIHAVSPQSMMAAVDAGVKKLVHTPHFGWLTFAEAKRVAAAGSAEAVDDRLRRACVRRFRRRQPAALSRRQAVARVDSQGDGRGQEAGYKAVNARTIWDNGVVYGFGTDTNYEPKAGLAHELKRLNLMFSLQDIVKLMGPNSAAYIEMSNDLGTLEPGKLADVVVLDGDPLEGTEFSGTKLVLKVA